MTQALTDLLEQVSASHAQALADLDTLAAATAQARQSLAEAIRQARRAAAFADFDQAALKEFFERPYLIQRASDTTRLIVPRFFGFRGGWLERHDGAYSIFVVNRFAHLINPLPDWLTAELGITAPTFDAYLEGTALTITAGDVAAAAGKIGAKAITRREGRVLHLRPSSRLDVIRRLIREEGILPFAPQPLPTELRRPSQIALGEKSKPLFTLREHQARDYAHFLELGAVLVVAYPQTGKTFLALQACAELSGRKLVLCPRKSLVEQWRIRLAHYLTPAAAAEVIVSTYQSAGKYLKEEWTLVIFDEAHRVPADFAIETAMAIRTQARIGLSATPFREDGQHDLMPMLCGYPVGADWPVTALQRPDVTVWIVPSEAEKIKLARQLTATPTAGKTLLYVQRLAIGEQLARALNVPFVSGKTKRQMQTIREHPMVIVSSVGDEGISVDVSRIIEVDFLFGSRMQAGQRLGRLANEFTGKRRAGEHHVLMTPHEYEQYGKRLLAYENWGLRLDIRTPDNDTPLRTVSRGRAVRASVRAPRSEPARAARAQRVAAPVGEPEDEVSQALQLPTIAAKIVTAERSIGKRTATYVHRVFRYCWLAALSAQDLADGLGIRDDATRSRLRSACKALAHVGLLTQTEGRYQVNQDEVKRLKALSSLRK